MEKIRAASVNPLDRLKRSAGT